MGLRERLSKAMRFLENARSTGHQLREEVGGEEGASSRAEQATHREARRHEGMTAEDREWEQASQQRNRDQQAHSGEPTISGDEPTISGDA
jgi:hypothetical protein